MAARILLIDDDAGIRESMRMPLEYEGYEYSAAASAEEGIAAIQRESPDIVFLDIKMPGMDGLEALHADQGAGRVAAGRHDLGARQRAVGAEATRRGADDFIEKPFGAERLLVTIRNVLEPGAAARREPHAEARRRSALPDGRRERRRCGRSGMRSSGRRRPTRPCCSSARAASARSWSRAPSIATACAAASASSR